MVCKVEARRGRARGAALVIDPPTLDALSEPILPTLFLLDYAGVAVFGATGALAAAPA